MEFFSNNEDMSNKWNNFLSTLEYSINKKAQKYFKDVINNKIRNAKIAQNNKTEDIEKEIKTSLKYYELDIKSRLSFLEEQANIKIAIANTVIIFFIMIIIYVNKYAKYYLNCS